VIQPRRPTPNEEACDQFRALLTDGFFTVDEHGEIDTPLEREAALTATKPWRGDVWKAFRALEDRLCPVRKFEKTGLP
jgi:hypothetical protein